MNKIHFFWFPGTWEVDWALNNGEKPSTKQFTGLGLWLTDERFPDRIPLNIYELHMLCPPDYDASFGPIPSSGSSIFSALKANSYEESVAEGLKSAIAQISKIPLGEPIVIGGYSQGAELASRVVDHFANGLLSQHLSDLKAVYTFGNPSRSQDRTFPNGNVLPWKGISNFYVDCPPGVLWRDYAFYDDMYANANPDSYLFDFYNALTDLQFHNPWQMVQNEILDLSKTDLMILKGAQPNNFAWVLTHMPQFISIGRKAVNSIDAATRFMSSGAHGRYAEWEIVPGLTPVFHAIRSMKYLAKGLGYEVAGI